MAGHGGLGAGTWLALTGSFMLQLFVVLCRHSGMTLSLLTCSGSCCLLGRGEQNTCSSRSVAVVCFVFSTVNADFDFSSTVHGYYCLNFIVYISSSCFPSYSGLVFVFVNGSCNIYGDDS